MKKSKYGSYGFYGSDEYASDIVYKQPVQSISLQHTYGYGYGYGQTSYTNQKERWQEYTYTPKDYSRATSYTYKPLDSTKIKKELKEKQKELNAKGYPIKINYSDLSSIMRKSSVSIVACNSVKKVDKILEFIEYVNRIGVTSLDSRDSAFMSCLLGEKTLENRSGTQFSKYELSKLIKQRETEGDEKTKYENFKKDMQEECIEEIVSAKGRGGAVEDLIRKSCDPETINNLKEKLANKIKIPPLKIEKLVSYRLGKRINRGYVQQTSNKPLVSLVEKKTKRKKVLQIVDASGSMRPSTIAKCSHFAYALHDLDIFDTTSLFSEQRNLIYFGENKFYAGGGEGFDELLTRLEALNIDYTTFDYIFVYTDLEVGHCEMQALADLIGTRKHLIFSFCASRTDQMLSQHPTIKIKNVKTIQDMINNIHHCT